MQYCQYTNCRGKDTPAVIRIPVVLTAPGGGRVDTDIDINACAYHFEITQGQALHWPGGERIVLLDPNWVPPRYLEGAPREYQETTPTSA